MSIEVRPFNTVYFILQCHRGGESRNAAMVEVCQHFLMGIGQAQGEPFVRDLVPKQ
jgi:hypothetical protein